MIKIIFTDNKAFFSKYCLNFLMNMLYIYVRKILWEFITIINLLKETSLWRSKLKEKKSLLKKRAKRLAKEGPKEEEVKPKTLDTSKPITLDFLTNPDKE
jgi:hypothetical protein